MDTITQMTLGAAVGEATLGKKVGNKALLWGAVAGTIPDLDVLAGPFMDTVSRMAFHRGFSHSLTFALLFAPVLGYLIFRIYNKKQADWWDWSKLVFWATVTHPLLDNFTSYGTQFFWPFSDYRIALNTIFVIDPLYTVPFLASVIAVLFLARNAPKRRIVNYLGIGISSAYLAFTVVNKIYINHVFEKQLASQNISYSRILTYPAPLNNILWRGVAEGPDGFWEGYYSLFDQDRQVTFDYFPKNHALLTGYLDRPQIRKLIWLTKGFYTMTNEKGELYLNDLRFGRLNGWGKFEGEFVFSFRIGKLPHTDHQKLYVERTIPEVNIDRDTLLIYARRVFGVL